MASMFKVTELEIPKVMLIEGFGGGDERGRSAKFFSKAFLENVEINFVPLEVLSIHSNENVLRGIHFQERYGQSKVISCINGELFVVAVDVERDSETFGKWCSVVLNKDSQMLYIPAKCAVGSFAITNSDFICMFGENPFMAEYEAGIIWNDEEIAVKWPRKKEQRIMSKKDENWPSFDEIRKNWKMNEER